MCSSRCEMPACGAGSKLDPAWIRQPMATERTLLTRSVTTRTPPGSVLSLCCGSAISAGPVTRAAGAALAAAWAVWTAVAGRATLATALAASASPATATGAAGADLRQLLHALAGDVGVLGQAQPDTAALAVDLDNPHLDLVTTVENLLDRVDAAAGRDVRDVQQAVGALGQLHEGAEGGRLDDLAGVFVADLDLLHHHPDPLQKLVCQLAVCGVDQHLAAAVALDLGGD